MRYIDDRILINYLKIGLDSLDGMCRISLIYLILACNLNNSSYIRFFFVQLVKQKISNFILIKLMNHI